MDGVSKCTLFRHEDQDLDAGKFKAMLTKVPAFQSAADGACPLMMAAFSEGGGSGDFFAPKDSNQVRAPCTTPFLASHHFGGSFGSSSHARVCVCGGPVCWENARVGVCALLAPNALASLGAARC